MRRARRLPGLEIDPGRSPRHLTFGPPKTRAARRSVPIPRLVSEELETHLGDRQPSEFVFTAPQGGPVRASLFRERVWVPAVRAAGLEPLRIHDLRHSAVSLWIAAGASPKEVASWAGHTSVSVVLDRYGHLLPGSEERVTNALDEMASTVAAKGASIVPPYP